MTKEDIVELPNPILRKTSQRVGVVNDEIRQIAKDMMEASLDWEKSRKNEMAAALAAVQIGKLDRIIIIRETNDQKHKDRFYGFVNPEIVKTEGAPEKDSEGCLSIKSIYGMVPRYPKIKLKAVDLNGKPVRLTATGFLARLFQHEIDHLHGKLFVDRTKEGDFYRLDDSGEFIPLKRAEYGKYLVKK